MVIVYEYMTIGDFFLLFLQALIIRGGKKSLVSALFWIDASPVAMWLGALISSKFGLIIEKLNFQLLDIHNQRGELIRRLIPHNDLYLFLDLIKKNKDFSSWGLKNTESKRFQFFLQKQILSGGITQRDSMFRALYLINVVALSKVLSGYKERELVLQERPWKKEFSQYAEKFGIRLRWSGWNRARTSFHIFVLDTLYKMPRVYNLLQWIRGKGVNNFETSHHQHIFIEGRGDSRIINDGNNSDFYWMLQAGFSREQVVYLSLDMASQNVLKDSGIHTVSENDTRAYILPMNFRGNYRAIRSDALNARERRELIRLSHIYRAQRGIWSGFFKQYNIKVFMTWNKSDGMHAIMADAIQALGGISAVNQVSFDGFRSFEHQVSTDLAFGFSGWSAEIEHELMSEIPYFVIAGYPRDHARPLLEKQARVLRDKLERAGATKIVFIIDGNSLNDNRWQSGHEIQQENYRYVLERVLDTPWLGAIFKPKAPHSLRERLGEVNELLCAAERTGRCMVLENKHYVTTVESVLLAGLVADVAIHGHLLSGTAALECALAGIPTLLIDRENVPFSKLNELPRGTVVFESWTSTISAVIDHFSSKNSVPGFGDWGEMLDELDPFRDGKASYRIGTYLKWLLDGFDSGLDRDQVLTEAASRYMDEWGADKVVSIGGNELTRDNGPFRKYEYL